jgi:hypothetical protein
MDLENGSMMTDIGYETRCNILLNVQCAKCGVWVAPDGKHLIEFDGRPHTCTGKPYGKRPGGEKAELAPELL